MKKQYLTISAAVLFALGSFTFVGCGGSESHHEEEHHEHMEGEHHHDEEMEEGHEHHEHMEEGEHMHAEGMGYRCPMKCEGDSIHTKQEPCSVCGMDLEEVKE